MKSVSFESLVNQIALVILRVPNTQNKTAHKPLGLLARSKQNDTPKKPNETNGKITQLDNSTTTSACVTQNITRR